MGKSHALSGAVGWLAGCAGLAALGVDLPDQVIAGGALVSTGFALLPDLDHEGSTVSRTLGPVTGFLSGMVAGIAVDVRASSCTHCSGRDDGGHRGLTHTGLGALAAGLAVAVCGVVWPQPAAYAVIGFAVWLAAHAALKSSTRAKIGDWVLPGRFRRRSKGAFRFTAGVGSALLGAAAAAALVFSTSGPWWWLGIPVFWGCLAHSLGDAMTLSRVPLLWPARIRGCRWTPVGMPRALRFRTGSRTESAVVWLMAATGFASLYVLGNI